MIVEFFVLSFCFSKAVKRNKIFLSSVSRPLFILSTQKTNALSSSKKITRAKFMLELISTK